MCEVTTIVMVIPSIVVCTEDATAMVGKTAGASAHSKAAAPDGRGDPNHFHLSP